MSKYDTANPENNLADFRQFMAPAMETLTTPVRLSLEDMVGRVNIPDSSGGAMPYSLELTPYLKRPMEDYTDRGCRKIVFVSGQRIGKSAGLVVMPVVHSLIAQPADVAILCPSQESASRVSSQDIGRTLLHNDLERRQVAGGMFQRAWDTGARTTTLWPTEQQLRGLTVRTIICSEVDSYPAPPDDKADWVALAEKRIQTAGTLGKVIIEGSPSAAVSVPDEDLDDFQRLTHGTYPTASASVANEYEKGDRCRWFWRCPDCNEEFHAGFECVRWDASKPTIRAQAATAHIVCPNCGAIHEDRKALNDSGVWRTAAEVDGVDEPPSKIRSYWLNGTASPFIPLSDLVENFLNASSVLSRTGNELPLRAFYKSDLGEQYIRPESARIGGKRISTVEGRFPRWEVVDEVVMLIATVDTQKRSWAVCYFGLLPDRQMVVIGREDIHEIDGSQARPFDHAEQWPLMFNKVIGRELFTSSGVRIPVQKVVIDVGGGGGELGETSASQNAYTLWKHVRKTYQTDAKRLPLLLTKGSRRVDTTIQWAKQASERSGALLFLVGHTVTGDMVVTGLTREEDGPGKIYFHHDFQNELVLEMQAERKTPAGWFERIGKARNEQFDLTRMAYACYDFEGLDKIDWANPPEHLLPAGDPRRAKHGGIK